MQRDPLPRPLRVLRNHVGTVALAIDAYEKLVLSGELGASVDQEKLDRAVHRIEARMQEAADTIGILPSERQALMRQISQLQSALQNAMTKQGGA